jgi:hypothetical protein
MKIYDGMEQIKYLIFKTDFYMEFYQPLFGEFYFVNMFPLLDDYPQKLFHTFNRVKMCRIN